MNLGRNEMTANERRRICQANREARRISRVASRVRQVLGEPRKTQFGHSCAGSSTTNDALGIPHRKHVRVR
jgi:hypothetical protein